jgi:hypothetical protein
VVDEGVPHAGLPKCKAAFAGMLAADAVDGAIRWRPTLTDAPTIFVRSGDDRGRVLPENTLLNVVDG